MEGRVMSKLRMRHYASGPRKGYWLVSGGAWEMLVGPFGTPEWAWGYARGETLADQRARAAGQGLLRRVSEPHSWPMVYVA